MTDLTPPSIPSSPAAAHRAARSPPHHPSPPHTSLGHAHGRIALDPALNDPLDWEVSINARPDACCGDRSDHPNLDLARTSPSIRPNTRDTDTSPATHLTHKLSPGRVPSSRPPPGLTLPGPRRGSQYQLEHCPAAGRGRLSRDSFRLLHLPIFASLSFLRRRWSIAFFHIGLFFPGPVPPGHQPTPAGPEPRLSFLRLFARSITLGVFDCCILGNHLDLRERGK